MGSSNRVSPQVAINRLREFELLSGIIKKQELAKQIDKSVENYSLITGWLTTHQDEWDRVFHKNTESLEALLVYLRDNLNQELWKKIRKKASTLSDRAESKGTIAELSFAKFLVMEEIPFEMENKIKISSEKNVDFSLPFESSKEVHIEIQSLSDSKYSVRTSLASYRRQKCMNIDFQSEEKRVRNKIYDKTCKLVEDRITIVALDCTAIPEHGGMSLGTIPDSMNYIFQKEIHSVLCKRDTTIRQLVDGVIWFQVDFNEALQPYDRGYILNEHSMHNNSISLGVFIDKWTEE